MANRTKTNALSAAEKSATLKLAKQREIERKREIAATTKALKPSATKVNRAMDKYVKLSGQADDARLEAACVLAEAKAQCEAHKLNFKKWCVENVKHSYETIRKLVPVGAAENEAEGAGAKMLADMREKNAKRNIAFRARENAKKKTTREQAPRTPKDLREAFLKLDADAQTAFVSWAAEQCGLEFTKPESEAA